MNEQKQNRDTTYRCAILFFLEHFVYFLIIGSSECLKLLVLLAHYHGFPYFNDMSMYMS